MTVWRRPWGVLCAFTASAIGWFRSPHSPLRWRAAVRRSASTPWSSPRSPAMDRGRLHHSLLPRPSASGVWSSLPTSSVHCASTRRRLPRRPQRNPLLPQASQPEASAIGSLARQEAQAIAANLCGAPHAAPAGVPCMSEYRSSRDPAADATRAARSGPKRPSPSGEESGQTCRRLLMFYNDII